MISEKLELLGKGCYADIPDTITITSIPTASELDYVGSEDFEATMLDKIFPKAIEEKCNWRQLLEIDFYWICRCMRLINYGPYFTTNRIMCRSCRNTSVGEYQVDLRSVDCKPLPDKFKNEIKISKDEFIDYDGDIVIKLPTVQDMINWRNDTAFQDESGNPNRELARLCYMIKSMKGETNLTPLEYKLKVLKDLSSADYIILKEVVDNMTDYGLRAGGSTTCPKCGEKATFLAFVDDRFLQPTLGDLRRWKSDRKNSGGESKDIPGSKTGDVRKNN